MQNEESQNSAVVRGWRRVLPLTALGAGIALTVVLFMGEPLKLMFGPPAVQMVEAYGDVENGPTIDHSTFDALLGKYIDKDGGVDYAALKKNAAGLDQYISMVAAAPLEDLSRNERLALLINAYNAFTLRLILDHYPIESIRKIPGRKRWDDKRWLIGGKQLSLNQIEHAEIRSNFREPRIHFALVCAAVGCPPLRDEAYQGDRIEAQLADQARRIHTSPRWFRLDEASGTLYLTKLYDWYGGDFEQEAGSVLSFAARHSPELSEALSSNREPRVRWLRYDWSLNDQVARASR